jgi:hypothetical protein
MQMTGRHRYAAVLALIAILILALGYAFRPSSTHPQNRIDDLTATRVELENLQQLVRRNNLRALSSNFLGSGEESARHVIVVQPWGWNGVLVPDLGLVVAKPVDALPRQLSTPHASLLEPIAFSAWVPGLPFFVGRPQPGSDVSPARLGPTLPSQGGWMIVVARGPGGQMLLGPGIFDGIVQSACGPFIHSRLHTTVPLHPAHMGGGAFDLSGDLFGLVLPCDDGPAIVSIQEIRSAVASVSQDSGVVLTRYGMRFSGTLAPLPSTTVSEVWDGWPAAQSGIEPGDEVLSVDDRPTPLPQDAVSLLMRSPSSEHDLRIRRGRRNLALHIRSMGLLEASNVRPAVYIEDTEGLTIARVPKGSSADNAGLLPSDRLLVVDGRPATKQLVERAFGQFRVAAPVTVIVRRPGRRLLVQVLP